MLISNCRLLILIFGLTSANLDLYSMEQTRSITLDYKNTEVIAGLKIEQIKHDNTIIDLTKLKASDINTYESNKNDPLAAFILAYLYDKFGNEIQKNRISSLYSIAASSGIIEAYNNLGCFYENNKTSKNVNLALEYYKKAEKLKFGKLNSLRLQAITSEDNELHYSLGNTYLHGDFAEANPNLAFFWFHKCALKNHKKAMYKVGCMFKLGLGINKDIEQAILWLKKATEENNDEACLKLGTIYYYGEGIEKDHTLSFKYRKQAAENHNLSALLELALMYEQGEGVELDLAAALSCYKIVAQSTNKISAIYSVAKILEILTKFDEAILWYKKVLKINKKHVGACYRLALIYEKGLGTNRDLPEALKLYSLAAQNGHLPSRIKLRFLKRQDILSIEDSINSLPQDIQLNFINESDRVKEELDKNYTISTYLPQRAYNHRTDQLETRFNYSIKEDFEATLDIVNRVKTERKDNAIDINYAFIANDPYLKYYFKNLDIEISDEEVNDTVIINMFNEMQDACLQSNHPAFLTEMLDEIVSIKNKFLVADSSQILLRKRLLNQYKKWIYAEAAQECLNLKAEAAIKIIQNSQRCLDGLERYLDAIELQEIYGVTLGKLPFGARISKVLNKYKEDFLNKHKNTRNNEETVEAMRLLKERMRLPLGLPGTFSCMLFPSIGQGRSEAYETRNVMFRFLKGGRIPNQNFQTLDSYEPKLLINLLKQAINDNDNHLIEREHLHDFIKTNAKLKKYFEKAFIEGEPNKYFDPMAVDSSDIYKDQLFEKILRHYGYIIKRK